MTIPGWIIHCITAACMILVAWEVYYSLCVAQEVMQLTDPSKKKMWFNDSQNSFGLFLAWNFMTMGIAFLLVGLMINYRLFHYFKDFYLENWCSLWFSTIGLSLPLIARGILDYKRCTNDDLDKQIEEDPSLYNTILYLTTTMIPTIFQLSSLVFGYIRRKDNKKKRRQELGAGTGQTGQTDSQYSRRSFESSSKSQTADGASSQAERSATTGSYFDPPLLQRYEVTVGNTVNPPSVDRSSDRRGSRHMSGVSLGNLEENSPIIHFNDNNLDINHPPRLLKAQSNSALLSPARENANGFNSEEIEQDNVKVTGKRKNKKRHQRTDSEERAANMHQQLLMSRMFHERSAQVRFSSRKQTTVQIPDLTPLNNSDLGKRETSNNFAADVDEDAIDNQQTQGAQGGQMSPLLFEDDKRMNEIAARIAAKNTNSEGTHGGDALYSMSDQAAGLFRSGAASRNSGIVKLDESSCSDRMHYEYADDDSDDF